MNIRWTAFLLDGVFLGILTAIASTRPDPFESFVVLVLVFLFFRTGQIIQR